MISFTKKLTAVILAIVLTFGLNVLIAKAAWTSAPSNPPSNNTDAPINVGTSDQTKNALLTVKGLWSTAGGYFSTMIGVATLVSPLSVGLVALFNGKIGATAYCDVNGQNCVSSSGLSAATSTVSATPSGAVMAFDLDACPSGWIAYTAAAGRNIIGTGTGYALRSVGGESTHRMTQAELVSHSHGYRVGTRNVGSNGKTVLDDDSGSYRVTDATGGSQPFNVMDPYVALLYCKKN